MFRRKSKPPIENPTKKHYILEIVKAVITAIVISLASILILAFIVRAASIDTGILPIINQVIKGVAILIACLVCLRLPKNAWVRGIVVGLIYVILAFVIFSLLNGAQFNFGLNVLNDVAVGAVSGLLSGIISGLIRKRAVARGKAV